jgi:GntR family transcriptional regulator
LADPLQPRFALREGATYQRVAARLRDEIRRGEFRGGRRLPTEAELSTEWQVSRQTVRRAFHELVGEGLVFRVRGRGTYAKAMPENARYLRSFGTIDDLLALAVDTTLEVVAPLERRLVPTAARQLERTDDEVMALLVRRFHAGSAFCATEIFLPADVGAAVAASGALPPVGERSARTVISVVDEVCATIAGAHQRITVCAAGSANAELIECRQGEPALRVERLYFDGAGRNVELAVSHFNPHRYSYRLELRRRLGPQSTAAS